MSAVLVPQVWSALNRNLCLPGAVLAVSTEQLSRPQHPPCPPLALLPLLLQGGITLVGSASFLEGRGNPQASSAGATLLGMGLVVVAEAVQAAQVTMGRRARSAG